MNIQINDVDALLEQAGDLSQLSSNISNVQGDLLAASTKISNAWASDTVDKETYLKSLNENLGKIATLTTALDGLSKSLTTYAEQQKQNEKK